MILEHLSSAWKSNKFSSSWIIGAKDESTALLEVTKFASQILAGKNNLPIENNPDFRIIRREKNTTGDDAKFIAIDQIRELQKFLHKTATLDLYKIAIIYQAHLMNTNSSDSCLKILEETPKNSFIFLITSSPSLLIPTIRSRCSKIHVNEDFLSEDKKDYLELLSYLDDRKLFLKKIASGFDKKDFEKFSCSVMDYFSTIDKENFTESMISKYDKIIKIISNTKELDLDPKVSAIIILEELLKN